MKTLMLQKLTVLQGAVLLFQPDRNAHWLQINRYNPETEPIVSFDTKQNENNRITLLKYLPKSDRYILHTRSVKNLLVDSPEYFKNLQSITGLEKFKFSNTFVCEATNDLESGLFIPLEEFSRQITQNVFDFAIYDIAYSARAVQAEIEKHFKAMMIPSDLFLKVWNYCEDSPSNSLFKKFLSEHLFQISRTWKKKRRR